MLSRALIACLLAATLAGCGGLASLFAPATGTVTGHVQIRACGGAYRPQQTGCPAQPMAGATLTFQPIDAGSPSKITTDSSGAYRIDLKPGTYRVHAMEEGSTRQGFAGFSGPTTVTVVAGKTVTADFTYTIQLL
jgi:Carboxypeptidase regulatory-like domain